MEKKKLGFEDFIVTVEEKDKAFVEALHQDFTQCGCTLEIKEAKSGLVVSYLYNKKTLMNYVFRKKGLIVRIYANQIARYWELLEGFPDGMIKAIQDAPLCKRLLNPTLCNARCPMGYDFILKNERYQKCRYSAFMFLVCPENNPSIKAFLEHEIKANS